MSGNWSIPRSASQPQKKFLYPSEDPVATTRVAIFDEQLKITEQYQENIAYATNSNELAESVLGQIVLSLDRARELAVQTNISTMNEDDFRSIANEIDGLSTEIANLMNSKDGVGDFLFSGFQGLERPFIERSGGGYEYRGDSGERILQVSSDTKISFTFSGKPVFVDVDSSSNTLKTSAASQNSIDSTAFISVGEVSDQEQFDANFPTDYLLRFNDPPTTYNVVNRFNNAPIVGESPAGLLTNVPYSEGDNITFNGVTFFVSGEPQANDTFFIESSTRQDILTGLYRFSKMLRDQADDMDSLKIPSVAEKFQADFNNVLNNMDNALLSVSQERSKIGVILQQLDRVFEMHEGLIVEVKSFLSDVQDLDYAEAATTLSQESLILQAAQASFSRVSSLTIFNYL